MVTVATMGEEMLAASSIHQYMQPVVLVAVAATQREQLQTSLPLLEVVRPM